MNRDELISALFKHGPVEWDENDIGILADSADDFEDGDDAEALAHLLWTMGGIDPAHTDCRYRDGDFDADYENQCSQCREWLTTLATAILADREEGNQ